MNITYIDCFPLPLLSPGEVQASFREVRQGIEKVCKSLGVPFIPSEVEFIKTCDGDTITIEGNYHAEINDVPFLV